MAVLAVWDYLLSADYNFVVLRSAAPPAALLGQFEIWKNWRGMAEIQ